VISIISGVVVGKQTKKLYNALLGPETYSSYASWRTIKNRIFMENLMIPAKYHNDPEIGSNICPITGQPVRYPVRSPHCPDAVFEEGALLAALEIKAECPVTRLGLTSEFIIRDNELREAIKNRIIYLKENPQIVEEQNRKHEADRLQSLVLLTQQKRTMQERMHDQQAKVHTLVRESEDIETIANGLRQISVV
jgi:Zinc-finger of the MIZ type in Nse subunit